MKIEIDDSFAHVTYEKNNVSYSKTITVDTLVSSLVSQYGVRTPMLPPGCRFYEKKGEQHIIYMEIPPMQRRICYVNREHKTIFEGLVPFPWALLKFNAVNQPDGTYGIQGGYIYAMRRPLLAEDDPLFFFPAANIHGNHAICWGSTFSRTNGSRFRNLGETGRLVDLYFSSEFNTDLSPRMNRYERYEDMLRGIKDQKIFDNSILVPSGKTFTDLIQGRC